MSPWLIDAWTTCLEAIRSSTPPHAWCLASPQGMNSQELTERLTKNELCLKPMDGEACQTCDSCRYVEMDQHPDLLRLEPEGIAGMIKIERVREAIEDAYKTGAIGGGRVIQINSADALNEASSNALLKIVEEPPHGTVFVFSTSVIGMLLPTLLSRLRVIRVRDPSIEEWIDFGAELKITEKNVRLGYALLGSPLICHEVPERFSEANTLLDSLILLSEGQDPEVLAKRFVKADPHTVCVSFTRVIESLIRSDVNLDLANLSHLNLPSTLLFQLLDRIQEVRFQAQRGIAINNAITFGSLFSVWSFISTKH